MNDEVTSYIKKEFSLGKSKEQISKELVEQGEWNPEDLERIWDNFEQGIRQPAPTQVMVQPQAKSIITHTLSIAGVLLCLYLVFAIYEWKKEVDYRMFMQDIFTKSESAYDKLDLLMKDGTDQEIIENCSSLMQVYGELASRMLDMRAPKKYKESHSYMRSGILDLNLSIVTICSGFKEQSKSGILQGIEINRAALKKMVEGQAVLANESKNRSILERLMTREN